MKLKLSEKLERYRTDRPDEWTMDEFARQARQLEDALLDARSGPRRAGDIHVGGELNPEFRTSLSQMIAAQKESGTA